MQSRRAPALINTCHDARFAPHVGANVNAEFAPQVGANVNAYTCFYIYVRPISVLVLAVVFRNTGIIQEGYIGTLSPRSRMVDVTVDVT